MKNLPGLAVGFVPRTHSGASSQTPVKKKRFDSLDLAGTIIGQKIKSKDDLLELLNVQREEGKQDLPLYVLNTDRCVKLIGTTWVTENAKEERKTPL